MKNKLLALGLGLVLLCSCSTTEKVLPDLPEISFPTPVRPETESYEDLANYADKLEIIIEGWETLYNGMITIFGSQGTTE